MLLPCCLVITLITSILDTFMFGFFMYHQFLLPCCLIITLITKMFDNFMLGFKSINKYFLAFAL